MNIIQKQGSVGIDKIGNKNGNHMKDIILYSDFANRLLNKTTDPDFNKRYQSFRRKYRPKQIISFYQRMAEDTMNR